jgi:uncharacterized protein (DUF427 family)
MNDFPAHISPPESVQPVPRRIRGSLDGLVALDTTRALYVWEHPRYPQYYVPPDDVLPGLLVPEDHVQQSAWGKLQAHGLKHGTEYSSRAAKVVVDSRDDRLAGMVRFNWDALDAWFEEDEQIFVHPRNPYVRVDALRSTRSLRVELDGVELAESTSPVMVFETGLPTRYYVNRSEVRFDHLVATDTVTACPYKGVTNQYWSFEAGAHRVVDVAWSYEFTTAAVTPIAGLVAFYNEKVDIYLDGHLLERPAGH